MIIVKLMGGLGNQMFQYAAAKALSVRHGVTLKVDLSFLNDRSARENFTFREYELDCFDNSIPIATNKELSIFNPPNKIISSLKSFLGISGPMRYCENTFKYNVSFSELPNEILLEGYFQSEKYFLQIRSLLLQDFKWRSPATGVNLSLTENIKSTNSVSLHIRRGDFAENKVINSFHGLCDINYYKRAISHINLNFENAIFFIFSDDINWAKKEIGMTSKVVYVDHNIGKESYWDMRLMSYCKHNIIANSSFSWWGAHFNSNPDKKVIYPSKWFGPNYNHYNTKDMYPPSWSVVSM
jgi:hypothetical protein